MRLLCTYTCGNLKLNTYTAILLNRCFGLIHLKASDMNYSPLNLIMLVYPLVDFIHGRDFVESKICMSKKVEGGSHVLFLLLVPLAFLLDREKNITFLSCGNCVWTVLNLFLIYYVSVSFM